MVAVAGSGPTSSVIGRDRPNGALLCEGADERSARSTARPGRP